MLKYIHLGMASLMYFTCTSVCAQTTTRQVDVSETYGVHQQYYASSQSLIPVVLSMGVSGTALLPIIGNSVVLVNKNFRLKTTKVWGVMGVTWGSVGLAFTIIGAAMNPFFALTIGIPCAALSVVSLVLGAVNVHRTRNWDSEKEQFYRSPYYSQAQGGKKERFIVRFQ